MENWWRNLGSFLFKKQSYLPSTIESVNAQKEAGKGISSVLRKCKMASKQWVWNRKSKEESIPSLERKCAELEDDLQSGSRENRQVAELMAIPMNVKEMLLQWGSIHSGFFSRHGAMSGYFGAVGIGGALTDHSGKLLITFFKSAGCVDAPTAEVLAVREACVLFAASTSFSSSKLIVGCDCSNVVKWFSHPSSTPSFIKATVVECIEVCSQVDWKVVLIPRSQNTLVDFLAKRGINRGVERIVFH
ncbi:hypothetical protein V6N12_010935 [Hibiscus sabdariffa]|uniref:RNase H type-1 domain-containing protein n=1 Tax=Hibiscus sabdariffa TaxID=183260 RepID=A0ABR2ELK7_9ROSI